MTNILQNIIKIKKYNNNNNKKEEWCEVLEYLTMLEKRMNHCVKAKDKWESICHCQKNV